VTLLYLVDNYYDGADEFGLAWDDPDVVVNWGTDATPMLSARDAANPRFRDIPKEHLPH
jgi:dTDP-4-dehydrorhamnose 3,5-epimerase